MFEGHDSKEAAGFVKESARRPVLLASVVFSMVRDPVRQIYRGGAGNQLPFAVCVDVQPTLAWLILKSEYGRPSIVSIAHDKHGFEFLEFWRGFD